VNFLNYPPTLRASLWRKTMKKTQYLALILCLGVAACDRVSEEKSQYELKPQIPMNANLITVTYDFNPYTSLSESDQLFSKALIRDIERWAKTRLRIANPDGVVQISMRKATITGIPNMRHLKALEGNLDVVLNILNGNGAMVSFVEASVKQKLSAPPNMTDNEYEALKKNLIIKLVDGLDREFESALYTRINAPYSGRTIKQ
jgi:hypothetical protein